MAESASMGGEPVSRNYTNFIAPTTVISSSKLVTRASIRLRYQDVAKAVIWPECKLSSDYSSLHKKGFLQYNPERRASLHYSRFGNQPVVVHLDSTKPIGSVDGIFMAGSSRRAPLKSSQHSNDRDRPITPGAVMYGRAPSPGRASITSTATAPVNFFQQSRTNKQKPQPPVRSRNNISECPSESRSVHYGDPRQLRSEGAGFMSLPRRPDSQTSGYRSSHRQPPARNGLHDDVAHMHVASLTGGPVQSHEAMRRPHSRGCDIPKEEDLIERSSQESLEVEITRL